MQSKQHSITTFPYSISCINHPIQHILPSINASYLVRKHCWESQSWTVLTHSSIVPTSARSHFLTKAASTVCGFLKYCTTNSYSAIHLTFITCCIRNVNACPTAWYIHKCSIIDSIISTTIAGINLTHETRMIRQQHIQSHRDFSSTNTSCNNHPVGKK